MCGTAHKATVTFTDHPLFVPGVPTERPSQVLGHPGVFLIAKLKIPRDRFSLFFVIDDEVYVSKDREKAKGQDIVSFVIVLLKRFFEEML